MLLRIAIITYPRKTWEAILKRYFNDGTQLVTTAKATNLT